VQARSARFRCHELGQQPAIIVGEFIGDGARQPAQPQPGVADGCLTDRAQVDHEIPFGQHVEAGRARNRADQFEPSAGSASAWRRRSTARHRSSSADRVILVEAGQAAQFSTLTPHAITAHDRPVEILAILDRDGRRAHLDAVDLTPES